MSAQPAYDIAFVGHFTKDTIIHPASRAVSMGGAFNFGASVAAHMGLRTLVVTRLAAEDIVVIQRLRSLGVECRVTVTPASTCLRLVYPNDNPDDRTVYLDSSAGAFGLDDVESVAALSPVWVIGASVRGEVPLEVVRLLGADGRKVSLDLQGYLRVERDRVLVHEAWPDAAAYLGLAYFAKADSVEAAALTGETDVEAAAHALAGYGPREVIVTAREGVTVLADGKLYQAPWRARTLSGRSGRGDTCTASYICKRLSANPAEATIWAAALTSLKMEQPGVFHGAVTDVERLIRTEYSALS